MPFLVAYYKGFLRKFFQATVWVADGIEFEVWVNNGYQICRPVPSPNECVRFKGNGKPDSNKMTFEIFVLVNYDMSFTNK